MAAEGISELRPGAQIATRCDPLMLRRPRSPPPAPARWGAAKLEPTAPQPAADPKLRPCVAKEQAAALSDAERAELEQALAK